MKTLNQFKQFAICIFSLLIISQFAFAQTADCDNPGNFSVTPPAGTMGSGTVDDPYLIYNDAILNFQSEGVNQSLGFADPGIIFLLYFCSPNDVNPSDDQFSPEGGCATLNSIPDIAGGYLIDNGMGRLPDVSSVGCPVLVHIVPVIAPDVSTFPLLNLAMNCTSIDLNEDYPVFAVYNEDVEGCEIGQTGCSVLGGSIATDAETAFCADSEVAPNDIDIEFDGEMGDGSLSFLTDVDGNILLASVNNVIPSSELLSYGSPLFVYGLTYEGAVPDYMIGESIQQLDTDCSEISSNAIEINIFDFDAGTLETDSETTFSLCGSVGTAETFWVEDFEGSCGALPNGWTSTSISGGDILPSTNLWVTNDVYSAAICTDFAGIPAVANQDANITGAENSCYLHPINSSAELIGCSNANYDSSISGEFCVTSSVIDASAFSNVALSFYWLADGLASDYGTAEYSIGGGTWNILGDFSNNESWTETSFDIAEMDNQSEIQIRFCWNSGGAESGADPPFSIDEVTLTGGTFTMPDPMIVDVANNGGSDPYGYVLTEEDGTILGLVQNDGTFDFSDYTEADIFNIYGVAATETLPLVEPGSNINEIDALPCVGISQNAITVVLEPCVVGCEADAGEIDPDAQLYVCSGEEIDIAVGGFNNTSDYAQLYLLTDTDLNILDFSANGNFEAEEGAYIFHALNLAVAEIPDPLSDLIGQNAEDVLAGLECFNLVSQLVGVLSEITFEISQECNEDLEIIEFTVEVSGGLPQFANENDLQGANLFEYTISGNFTDDEIVTTNPSFTLEFPFDFGPFYFLNVGDAAACFAAQEGELIECGNPPCGAAAGQLIPPANTDVLIPGSSDEPTVSGNNVDPEFTTIFILTTIDDNTIIAYNETGSFDLSDYEAGDMFLVSNVNIEGSLATFEGLLMFYTTIDEWLNGIALGLIACADIGPAGFGYVLTVIEGPECEADAGEFPDFAVFSTCSPNALAFGTVDFNDDFAQVYIVTDEELNILAVSASPDFVQDPGVYIVHALNAIGEELPEDPNDLLGLNALDVLEGLSCYDLASSPAITILNPISYSIDGACDEDGLYNFTISFSGGLPEIDPDAFYQLLELDAIFLIGADEVFEGSFSNGPFDFTYELFDDSDCDGFEIVIEVPDCSVPPCEILEAGEISTESETIICTIGDEIIDVVSVQSSGVIASNFAYIITDSEGIVLAGPLDGPDFTFEEAEAGTCQIWGVAYEGELTVEVGVSIDEITAECLELTNPIEIQRIICCSDLMADDIVYEIDEASNTYTVSAEISGGCPPYEASNGMMDGNTYMSSIFNCGDAGSTTITDLYGNALPLDFEAPCDAIDCPGDTEAGSLTGGIQYLCSGSSFNVSSNGFNSNAGYVQSYFALNNGVVAAQSTDGSFDGLTSGTYAVHAINYLDGQGPAFEVGTSLEAILAQENACFNLSNGIDKVILTPVEIISDYSCDPNTGIYTISFTFTGGLPQYTSENGATGILDEIFYFSQGDLSGTYLFGDDLILEFPDNEPYQVSVMDALNCMDVDAELPPACSKTAVELLSFEGEALEGGNLIKWSTASEYENSYFIIQRSENGQDFEDLNRVEAVGNSNIMTNYDIFDTDFKSNTNYYRLQSVDVEGQFTLSQTIRIERKDEKLSLSIIQVGPVPFNSNLNIKYFAAETSNVELSLMNSVGQELQKVDFISENGENHIKLDTHNLASGIYFLSLTDGIDRVSIKILKSF